MTDRLHTDALHLGMQPVKKADVTRFRANAEALAAENDQCSKWQNNLAQCEKLNRALSRQAARLINKMTGLTCPVEILEDGSYSDRLHIEAIVPWMDTDNLENEVLTESLIGKNVKADHGLTQLATEIVQQYYLMRLKTVADDHRVKLPEYLRLCHPQIYLYLLLARTSQSGDFQFEKGTIDRPWIEQSPTRIWTWPCHSHSIANSLAGKKLTDVIALDDRLREICSPAEWDAIQTLVVRDAEIHDGRNGSSLIINLERSREVASECPPRLDGKAIPDDHPVMKAWQEWASSGEKIS